MPIYNQFPPSIQTKHLHGHENQGVLDAITEENLKEHQNQMEKITNLEERVTALEEKES